MLQSYEKVSSNKKNDNFESNTKELNRQFEDNFNALKQLIGEENFKEKIKDLGIYIGSNILYCISLYILLLSISILTFHRWEYFAYSYYSS